MSEQEKDENDLGSVGEPPPAPPPNGNVVVLHQYTNNVNYGQLMDFSPHDPYFSDKATFPYDSDPNSEARGQILREKSQGTGESEVQQYGVFKQYKQKIFGIMSPLLGNSREHMRPTIFSIDKYEITPRVTDPFMKKRFLKIMQGKGRRVHCVKCNREVTASHIDPHTRSCAFGGPEWNNCRPMGPAIGDEIQIIEVDNDE